VADNHRPADTQLVHEICDVVRKRRNGIRLDRSVTLAVAAQVYAHDSIPRAEVFGLWSEEGPIAGPPVDEHEDGFADTTVVESELHSVAGNRGTHSKSGVHAPFSTDQ
jgi:hypothetical protein